MKKFLRMLATDEIDYFLSIGAIKPCELLGLIGFGWPLEDACRLVAETRTSSVWDPRPWERCIVIGVHGSPTIDDITRKKYRPSRRICVVVETFEFRNAKSWRGTRQVRQFKSAEFYSTRAARSLPPLLEQYLCRFITKGKNWERVL